MAAKKAAKRSAEKPKERVTEKPKEEVLDYQALMYQELVKLNTLLESVTTDQPDRLRTGITHKMLQVLSR